MDGATVPPPAGEGPPPGAPSFRDRPGRHGGTLAATVAVAIEREIVELGWPVGRVIGSEAELLARHGVSRPVLRQAVGILESHQVARMRRGRNGGLVVTAPDELAVANGVALYLESLHLGAEGIHEAREVLEVRSVELATRRLDEARAERLRVLVATERERRLEDPAAQMDLHVAIAELSDNPVLALFVKVLIILTHDRFFSQGGPTTEELADDGTTRDHERIVEAMVAGDVALAQHRMRRHLQENARQETDRVGPIGRHEPAGAAAPPAPPA